MLDLFVFFYDPETVHRRDMKRIFELREVTSGRYSFGNEDGRYYFDFDKSFLNDYDTDEQSRIPYEISDVCDITYYPPEVLESIVARLAEYDKKIYVDDDHDNIMNILEFQEKMLKKEIYPYNYRKTQMSGVSE